jgi:hypothetical protein
MPHHKFTARLAPRRAKWDSGYADGPGLNLTKIAEEVYEEKVPGPWLAVYMLRRFGWPNTVSDDVKDLCSWMLTTPLAGLYLVVTPYLGGGGNLHFAVRFTREVGNKVDGYPGSVSFVRRREAAVRRWWDQHGCELYIVGQGKIEGEENDLVHKAEGSEKDGKVWGVWKRLPADERQRFGKAKADPMMLWWLTEFITAKHPEADIPSKMTDAEKAHAHTAFQARAVAAIKRTMRDLLRPTSVRDVEFGVFGRNHKRTSGPQAKRWEGAGNTPEYWFSPHAKGKRAKAQKRPAPA